MSVQDLRVADIRTDGGTQTRVSPMALFADITYISDAAWVKRITSQCVEQGYIPVIDFDEQEGVWVFHSIMPPDGTVSRKAVAAKFASAKSQERAEATIRDAILASLKAKGIRARKEVACAVGIADIVSPEAVYEVKLRLDRDAFFHGLGQVLLYRNAINPAIRAVLIGGQIGSARHFTPYAESLGVEVMIWRDAR